MIKLSDRLRSELIALADKEAPQEAVALVSAPAALNPEERDQGDFYALWRAKNVAEEPNTSFLIHPADQAALLSRIWGRDEDVVGIFHSHPRSGPDPSERDREFAAAIEAKRAGEQPLVWVIVGKALCQTCQGGLDHCSNCGGWGDVDAFWVGTLA